MKIQITNNYGFAHYWTLVYRNKSYYLGQDVKVCNRLLNMLPRDVVQAIGTREIDKPTGNKKLAQFIVKTLKETHSINFKNLQPWDLAVD
jgi:hypothetical protein